MRDIDSKEEFIAWLKEQPEDKLFPGGSRVACALARFSGQVVAVMTYGEKAGLEKELPEWAVDFNHWALKYAGEFTSIAALRQLS